MLSKFILSITKAHTTHNELTLKRKERGGKYVETVSFWNSKALLWSEMQRRSAHRQLEVDFKGVQTDI